MLQKALIFPTNPFFRSACFAAAIFAIIQLFWLGSKPVGVNLFNPPWDKLAHVATYLTICLLLWCGTGLRRRIVVVFVIACVASADEVHQLWLPGRSADWNDLAADAAALAIFWLITTIYLRYVSAMTIVPLSIQSD